MRPTSFPNQSQSSVSVTVQKVDVYLHPDLEIWTLLIRNGDNTEKLLDSLDLFTGV